METNTLLETIRAVIHEELSRSKENFSSQDLKVIQIGMNDLKNSQTEMKRELSEIKRRLLDPEEGVIVKVNENTRFRTELEKKHDREEIEYRKMMLEHTEMVKWKGGVNKALWIFFTALIGILAKMFFLSESN